MLRIYFWLAFVPQIYADYCLLYSVFYLLYPKTALMQSKSAFLSEKWPWLGTHCAWCVVRIEYCAGITSHSAQHGQAHCEGSPIGDTLRRNPHPCHPERSEAKWRIWSMDSYLANNIRLIPNKMGCKCLTYSPLAYATIWGLWCYSSIVDSDIVDQAG